MSFLKPKFLTLSGSQEFNTGAAPLTLTLIVIMFPVKLINYLNYQEVVRNAHQILIGGACKLLCAPARIYYRNDRTFDKSFNISFNKNLNIFA